jgi:hypothetical protein
LLVIILCGIPTEDPLARVDRELADLGVPYRFFNQRRVLTGDCHYEVAADGITGHLDIDGEKVDLRDVSAVYTRMMDYRYLPELAGLPADSAEREHCRRVHDSFSAWLEVSQARVVNRAEAMATNNSKPYQAQVIRSVGLGVPETLVTNQPDLARDFLAEHGRVIYKSTSGTRSIVHELDHSGLSRVDDIGWCPVQFQAYVEGVDVRVHVVGQRVYATRVSSTATDYRYSSVSGTVARLEPTELPGPLVEQCVTLTARLGLLFSGIDLRLTPAGEVVCFEVNPCPAYAYYEGHTGQPIARGVARYLAGAARARRASRTPRDRVGRRAVPGDRPPPMVPRVSYAGSTAGSHRRCTPRG